VLQAPEAPPTASAADTISSVGPQGDVAAAAKRRSAFAEDLFSFTPDSNDSAVFKKTLLGE
jgi:hypothetical protein